MGKTNEEKISSNEFKQLLLQEDGLNGKFYCLL